MSPRPYRSEARADAAADTRQRIVEAARSVLMAGAPKGFTIDAVAESAGVARMTVYHQFGSKRGLIEALFDDLAVRGGISQLRGAFQQAELMDALEVLVQVFTHLWGSQRPLLKRLRAYSALDPELERADRNLRRRQALTVLLERRTGSADEGWVGDMADILLALTSFDTYETLAASRSEEDVARLILSAAASLLADHRRPPA